MASAVVILLAAVPASAAEMMQVTFVRHGESEGNASGLIDTSVPGPVLTEKGQQQAKAVAQLLGDNNYDGIYASSMVRTQLTAAPMSQYLGLPIQVLPGFREIEAGIYEGTPEAEAADGYALYLGAWMAGQLDMRIPGASNGYEFNDRVNGALQTVYDNGDRNAVVFSHGGTIMIWTMINAQNLTLADKIKLLTTASLDNTDYVVVEGNPEDGWVLLDWNGQKFGTQPTLSSQVQMQFRTLQRQLGATTDDVVAAWDSHDGTAIATAANRGLADAGFSVIKFARAVNAAVIKEVAGSAAVPATTDSEEPVVPEDATTETGTEDTTETATEVSASEVSASEVSASEVSASGDAATQETATGNTEDEVQAPAETDYQAETGGSASPASDGAGADADVTASDGADGTGADAGGSGSAESTTDDSHAADAGVEDTADAGAASDDSGGDGADDAGSAAA
ncbi:histidine phosphatase family protein [Gordonia sp. DT218]|uniref:histidine phosphatase family protein n=1 Tax=Gordonia sp. DT218 TaxID=3416659 RepID=UPI003CF876BD